MSLNDRSMAFGTKAVDQHPGVANPTSSSDNSNPMKTNFVEDPTTDDMGAGAGENFQGHNEAARNFKKTAGVVEGAPGLIESSNIDPLNENSNKDDGWSNDTSRSKPSGATSSDPGYVSTATKKVTGAANLAYGTAMGDESAKQAGKEAVWGNQ